MQKAFRMVDTWAQVP